VRRQRNSTEKPSAGKFVFPPDYFQYFFGDVTIGRTGDDNDRSLSQCAYHGRVDCHGFPYQPLSHRNSQ
jgi:hypothetical protein